MTNLGLQRVISRDVRSEVIIKFSGALPTAKPAPNNKMEITLTDNNGVNFVAFIKAKTWHKAEVTTSQLPNWAGSISGKLGPRLRNAFEVLDAGIQIFEKKAKPPKDETET
ncbi:MAG: hypothetical protein V7K38_25835 [Nostoc sp.]|uniref:hypothetical protein n=1 Tax=Nostoc sp. TaxID=1180 RepID=UPI002FFB0516